MYFLKMKITAAKMSSQVCSARKLTALTAVLKRKCATWPISPGSREPSFAPISLSPPAIAFPVAFKALVSAPTTAPIVTPRGKKDSRHSNIVFFEDFFDLFWKRHGSFSFRDLSLQTRELFVSCCNPFFCSFFVKLSGVISTDNRLIFFILL